MDIRGQAALDLLLALVIALVVLASMGGILSSFTDTQKEISLHQQLDEQARLSALFLSLHSQYFHENYPYSTAPGGPPSFVDVMNVHIRSEGAIVLSPVRISGYAQGVPCSIAVNWSAGSVEFTSVANDAGLGSNVSAESFFVPRIGFDGVHSLDADGCSSPIVLEGN